MAETWVINESPNHETGFISEITFSSNNETFYRFELKTNSSADANGIKYDECTTVYRWWSLAPGWSNQAYRTVTFETSPTGELLTWLQENAVKQQPEPTIETWVINENPTILEIGTVFEINFTSNNENFDKIRFIKSTYPFPFIRNETAMVYRVEHTGDFNEIPIYGNQSMTWHDKAYRTVTFESAPTGNLLTWLQSNAVKQQPEPHTTVNLSTIITQTGKHTISIASKCDDYIDSDKVSIEYTKN